MTQQKWQKEFETLASTYAEGDHLWIKPDELKAFFATALESEYRRGLVDGRIDTLKTK